LLISTRIAWENRDDYATHLLNTLGNTALTQASLTLEDFLIVNQTIIFSKNN